MEKMPEWFKVKYNQKAVEEVSELMTNLKLNTVCKEANCPNLGECFQKHTATFMILGSQCTRNCRFCNVVHGTPEPVDPLEPQHIAEAAKHLGLRHVVITQVTRDDLPDGGASHFAKTIAAIRELCPSTSIEVLISDMKGDHASLDTVIAAHPEVINHNIETVPSLYSTVRPEANYQRSLDVLRYVKEQDPSIRTKTGIMVGLGETDEEVLHTMDDVLAVGCDIFTIGQYLRPSEEHIEMKEYVVPEKFDIYKVIGMQKGFHYIASSPLVRSSYRAAEALES
ncbi:lipoyl synthase [Roseburia sp. 499]|uniref:lipoyl synthase n=1 Tax=Roseburia sp. 499 TaxID=1261634 RepID=UPI0009522AF0|nr:lipoyl synthase [Roseburia sp. 499]WVK70637.1 lipoyl synthase [Roseburia sp. 499]